MASIHGAIRLSIFLIFLFILPGILCELVVETDDEVISREGTDTTLTCSFNLDPPDAKYWLRWKKYSAKGTLENVYVYRQDLSIDTGMKEGKDRFVRKGHNVIIPNTTQQDAGRYCCEASLVAAPDSHHSCVDVHFVAFGPHSWRCTKPNGLPCGIENNVPFLTDDERYLANFSYQDIYPRASLSLYNDKTNTVIASRPKEDAIENNGRFTLMLTVDQPIHQSVVLRISAEGEHLGESFILDIQQTEYFPSTVVESATCAAACYGTIIAILIAILVGVAIFFIVRIIYMKKKAEKQKTQANMQEEIKKIGDINYAKYIKEVPWYEL